MQNDAFTKQLQSIDNLPTLPVVAMEVNRLVGNEETSVAILSEVIGRDQALVPRILRLVNSAFFGLKMPVSNVKRAAVVLGFSTLRNAVLGLSVVDALSHQQLPPEFRFEQFWEHSMAVAAASRRLAGELHLPDAHDAYTAGLLHDIGKIVLCQHFPEHFTTAWNQACTDGIQFFDAEKNVNGSDHCQIGAFLAQRWQLPAELRESISRHHDTRALHHTTPCLWLCVYAADRLVHQLDALAEGSAELSLDEFPLLLKPVLMNVRDWVPELLQDIEDSRQLFSEGG